MLMPAICTIEDELHMGWGRGGARSRCHPTWNVNGVGGDHIQTSNI